MDVCVSPSLIKGPTHQTPATIPIKKKRRSASSSHAAVIQKSKGQNSNFTCYIEDTKQYESISFPLLQPEESVSLPRSIPLSHEGEGEGEEATAERRGNLYTSDRRRKSPTRIGVFTNPDTARFGEFRRFNIHPFLAKRNSRSSSDSVGS